jgi:hypothetical protein
MKRAALFVAITASCALLVSCTKQKPDTPWTQARACVEKGGDAYLILNFESDEEITTHDVWVCEGKHNYSVGGVTFKKKGEFKIPANNLVSVVPWVNPVIVLRDEQNRDRALRDPDKYDIVFWPKATAKGVSRAR